MRVSLMQLAPGWLGSGGHARRCVVWPLRYWTVIGDDSG